MGSSPISCSLLTFLESPESLLSNCGVRSGINVTETSFMGILERREKVNVVITGFQMHPLSYTNSWDRKLKEGPTTIKPQ